MKLSLSKSYLCTGEITTIGLHVESELQLRVKIRVVDFEETMDELLQVNISVPIDIQNREKALANNSRELGVL